MKVIKLFATALVLAASLSAANVEKQNQLAKDMRTMLASMQEIEKAGFYNDAHGMSEGVKRLKGALHSLTTTDAKSYLPDDQAYADKFAQKRASMIKLYADDLVASVKANDMDEALNNYSQILQQCSSCHIRIRAW